MLLSFRSLQTVQKYDTQLQIPLTRKHFKHLLTICPVGQIYEGKDLTLINARLCMWEEEILKQTT